MWLRMVGELMSIYIFGYALRSQLGLRMAGYLNYISSTYVFISFFVPLTKFAVRKLNNLMWLRKEGEVLSTYLLGKDIWLIYHLLNADNRPVFQWIMDTYEERSHLYLLQLCTWIIYCLIDIHDGQAQSQVSSKGQLLFIYYVQIKMSQTSKFWT